MPWWRIEREHGWILTDYFAQKLLIDNILHNVQYMNVLIMTTICIQMYSGEAAEKLELLQMECIVVGQIGPLGGTIPWEPFWTFTRTDENLLQSNIG